MYHVNSVRQGREGHWILWNWSHRQLWPAWYGCGKSSLGPLQEHPSSFVEPSFQPHWSVLIGWPTSGYNSLGTSRISTNSLSILSPTLLYLVFVLFWDTVSLWSLGCSGNPCIDQAGLKFTKTCLPPKLFFFLEIWGVFASFHFCLFVSLSVSVSSKLPWI